MTTVEPGPEPADDESAAVPPAFRMEIREVTGRGSSPEPGLARAHSMDLEGPDGRRVSIRRIDRSDHLSTRFEAVLTAEPVDFDECPICLTPNPTSREHVPPASMGGTYVTKTCKPCNNRFGSLLEVDLLDWYEDAIGRVTMSHPDVRGARRSSRVLFRQTTDGEPVVMPEGFVDPEISANLTSGSRFEFTYTPPAMARVKLAALKSSYLASCVLLRQIPRSEEADMVRAELLAVRDLPRREVHTLGPAASSMRLGRSAGPSTPGHIQLVRSVPDDGSEPYFAVSLAGSLLVSWPIGGFLAVQRADGTTQAWPLSPPAENQDSDNGPVSS